MVESLGGVFVGGTPGRANPCSTTPQAGPPTLVVAGTLTSLAGEPRAFTVTSPVNSGDMATMVLEGENGDLAYVLFASEPAAFDFPQWVGPLLLAPPLDGFAVGTLTGSPTTLSVRAPAIPPGAVDTLYMQGVFFTFPGITFGSPSVLTTIGT